MIDRNFVIVGLIFLSVQIYNLEEINKDDISINYEFDYHSNVEVKNSSDDFVTLISYNGKIETTAYILTDEQQLLLLKLNIYETGKFLNETNSIISIVIRKHGLVEKIIIDDSAPIGMINLLKGVINLMNIDEMRKDKIEPDISGECEVKYNLQNETELVKEKTLCNHTIVSSFTEPDVDTFSLYKVSKINASYSFNSDGSLLSIKSVETHSLEPVLFQDLIQEYKSSTIIKFNKLTKSRSLLTSSSLENVIRMIFGNSYREVFLMSTPEVTHYKNKNSIQALAKIQAIVQTQTNANRSHVTLEIINALRQITDGATMAKLMKTKFSKIMKEIIIDAAINCGTKMCSELVLREFDSCIKNDVPEANRILLLLQNIRISNQFIIKNLWPKIVHLPDGLYNQAIQTICSLIEISRNSIHLESVASEIINFITNKISSCADYQCFHVHFNAIRNCRDQTFRHTLIEFIRNDGNHSSKVIADAFNSIWFLRYNEENEIIMKKDVFQIVKAKINFYDPYVQYHSICCLVMLQIHTEQLVSILDVLQFNNTHYQYFLMKKLETWINHGIVKDYLMVLESRFFRNSKHMFISYSENAGSKILIKPLFTTDNSFMDIHFNIIGSEAGIIKHSSTDLFLVSTARENNVFSFSTHMSGLQSLLGAADDDVNEDVEGVLQLSLFGKLAKPIFLFQSTGELMSLFWNAPSELESVLRGSFVPIDSQSEIHFQNGIVLISNYMGSAFLDFSFQLTTSIWYKTAVSLLRTTGNIYAQMESTVTSSFKSSTNIKEITISTGIDFDTNIDFGSSPMKSCLSMSRLKSKVNSSLETSRNETQIDKRRKNMNLNGVCYSITNKMDQLCSQL